MLFQQEVSPPNFIHVRPQAGEDPVVFGHYYGSVGLLLLSAKQHWRRVCSEVATVDHRFLLGAMQPKRDEDVVSRSDGRLLG